MELQGSLELLESLLGRKARFLVRGETVLISLENEVHLYTTDDSFIISAPVLGLGVINEEESDMTWADQMELAKHRRGDRYSLRTIDDLLTDRAFIPEEILVSVGVLDDISDRAMRKFKSHSFPKDSRFTDMRLFINKDLIRYYVRELCIAWFQISKALCHLGWENLWKDGEGHILQMLDNCDVEVNSVKIIQSVCDRTLSAIRQADAPALMSVIDYIYTDLTTMVLPDWWIPLDGLIAITESFCHLCLFQGGAKSLIPKVTILILREAIKFGVSFDGIWLNLFENWVVKVMGPKLADTGVEKVNIEEAQMLLAIQNNRFKEAFRPFAKAVRQAKLSYKTVTMSPEPDQEDELNRLFTELITHQAITYLIENPHAPEVYLKDAEKILTNRLNRIVAKLTGGKEGDLSYPVCLSIIEKLNQIRQQHIGVEMIPSDMSVNILKLQSITEAIMSRLRMKSSGVIDRLIDGLHDLASDTHPTDQFFGKVAKYMADVVSVLKISEVSITEALRLVFRIRGLLAESFMYWCFDKPYIDESEKINLSEILHTQIPEIDWDLAFTNSKRSLSLTPDYWTFNEGCVTVYEIGWSSRPLTKKSMDEEKWRAAKSIVEDSGKTFQIVTHQLTNDPLTWEKLASTTRSLSAPPMVLKWKKSLTKMQSEMLALVPNLERYGEYLFSEGRAILKAKYSTYPHLPKRLFREKKDRMLKRLKTAMPKVNPDVLKKWVEEPKKISVASTYQHKVTTSLSPGRDFLFVGSTEEDILVEQLCDVSTLDQSIQVVNLKTATMLKDAWDKEDKNCSVYTPTIDPVSQIPFVEPTDEPWIDYIVELKKKSVFNKIVAEVPFPRADFKGVKEIDITFFRKYVKTKSKEDCKTMKLNWCCGRNGKLSMIDVNNSGAIINKGSSKVEPKLVDMSAEQKAKFTTFIQNFLPTFTLDQVDAVCDFNEKLAAMSKRITDVVEVIKPIWSMKPEERMEELSRRSQQNHSEEKIKKGTMLDMQNKAYNIIGLAKAHLIGRSNGAVDLWELLEKEVVQVFESSTDLNRTCIKALKSVFNSMSGYNYGKFLLLLNEIGSSYLAAKAESLTSGKLFIKRLKSFGCDLVISMSGSGSAASLNHKCVLLGPCQFTSFSIEQGEQVTDSMSHCFYLDERLCRLFESLVFQYASVSSLFLQYERQILDDDNLTPAAEDLISEVVCNSIFIVMKNNKSCNEMLQNYRYIVMGLINDFIDPCEMGSKLSVTCRSSVQHEFKKRMKSSILEWGALKEKGVLDSVNKDNILEEGKSFPSLLCQNKGYRSIQSVISEIYLCHLYDREGIQRDSSVTSVFKKSVETQMKFEERIEKDWIPMLGFDYDLTGNEFRDNCETIFKLPTSVVSFSGKMVHDAGIMTKDYLKAEKHSMSKAKLNVGVSDLSNSTSIVSKQQLSINWETAKMANKKSSLIRFIKTTGANKRALDEDVGVKLEWIRAHFGSSKDEGFWDKEMVDFARNYLVKKSQAMSSFKEVVDVLLDTKRFFSDDEYVKLLNATRWFTKFLDRKFREIKGDKLRDDRIKEIVLKLFTEPSELSFQSTKVRVDEVLVIIKSVLTKEDPSLIEKFETRWNQMMEIVTRTQSEPVLRGLVQAEAAYITLKNELDKKPELYKPNELTDAVGKLDVLTRDITEAYNFFSVIFTSVFRCRMNHEGKESDADWDLYPKLLMKSLMGTKLYNVRTIHLRFISETINNYRLDEILLTDGLIRGLGGKSSFIDSSHKSVLSMYLMIEPEHLMSLVVEHIVEFRNSRPETMFSQRKIKRRFWQIPSSPRNKVTLEIIERILEFCTNSDQFPTSIQKLAEVLILTNDDEFYGLAPKEQFGGVRELGIQDFKTKVTNYVSEHCSRSMNLLFNKFNLIEGLSHPSSKYYKVDDAITELRDRNVNPDEGETFKEVLAMNKDHSKWGPTHCPGFNFRCFFLGLSEHLDEFWDYMDLKMLASSTKHIEIPRPVVMRLLNIPDNSPKNATEEFTLKLLKQGHLTIHKVQDMIQGIHHHTSSLYSMGCQMIIHRIMKRCALSMGYICSLSTVQGSDDEETVMVLTESGPIQSDLEETVRRLIVINKLLEKLINFKTSPKSTYGRTIVEYNSNFSYGEANCAPSIKFTTSQFLMQSVIDFNEVVNSVYSMCQQGMYNSVPHMNTLLLALKHYSVYRRICLMQKNGRNYTGVKLNQLPFCLGGIWVPKHSDMLCNSLTSIELEGVYDGLMLDDKQRWILDFFDKEALGLETSDEVRHPSFFRLDHKKVSLRSIDAAKHNLRLVGERIKDSIKGLSVRESVISLLESLRVPFTTYTDYCRLASIIRAEKLSISLIEKSPVTYLRLISALYRGHYIKDIDQTLEIDLASRLKNAKTRDNSEAVVPIAEVNSLYTTARTVNEAVVIGQIRGFESSPVDKMLLDSDERSAWCRVTITNSQSVISNEVPTVLLTLVEDTSNVVTVSPSYDEAKMEVDTSLVRSLCKSQLTKLTEIISSQKEEDIKEGRSLMKEMVHICRGLQSRSYVLYGPGLRGSGERGFLEGLISRNSIRGLDLGISLVGYGQFAAERQFDSEKFIELVALLAKLFKRDILLLLLRFLGENPQLLGLGERNLKQVIRDEVSRLPDYSVEARLKLLTIASLIGDTTADARLNELATAKRQNYTLENNPGHSCFTTFSGVKIIRTFFNDDSSITISSTEDRTALMSHMSLFKIKTTSNDNSVLHPKRLFNFGDWDVLQLDNLDVQLIKACLELKKFSYLVTDDLLQLSLTNIDVLPDGGVPSYSTKIIWDRSMRQLLRNFDRKPKEVSCDLEISNTSIHLFYKGKPPTDYLDNLIANMESAKVALSFMDDVPVKDANAVKRELDRKMEALETRKRAVSNVEISLCKIHYPSYFSQSAVSTFLKLVQTDYFKQIGDKSHLKIKGDEPLPEPEPETYEEAEDESLDVSSIRSEELPSLTNVDVFDSHEQQETQRKHTMRKDVIIMKQRGGRKGVDLVSQFIQSTKKEKLIEASDYLRRYREDEMAYSRVWKTATASQISGQFSGVTFEDMADIYISGRNTERAPTDWGQFFVRNGLRGKTLKFFTLGMIIFHIKWPNMSSVAYKLLSFSTMRNNKLSVTKMLLMCENIFQDLNDQLSNRLNEEVVIESTEDGSSITSRGFETASSEGHSEGSGSEPEDDSDEETSDKESEAEGEFTEESDPLKISFSKMWLRRDFFKGKKYTTTKECLHLALLLAPIVGSISADSQVNSLIFPNCVLSKVLIEIDSLQDQWTGGPVDLTEFTVEVEFNLANLYNQEFNKLLLESLVKADFVKLTKTRKAKEMGIKSSDFEIYSAKYIRKLTATKKLLNPNLSTLKLFIDCVHKHRTYLNLF